MTTGFLNRPPNRLRFTLRQLMLGTLIIGLALGLVLTRIELAKYKQNTDPVPLVVWDATRIHLRQLPYTTCRSVDYRMHLPPGKKYRLCVATVIADRFGPDSEWPTPEHTVDLPLRSNSVANSYIVQLLPIDTEEAERQIIATVLQLQTQDFRDGGHYQAYCFPLANYPDGGSVHRPHGYKDTSVFEADEPFLLLKVQGSSSGSSTPSKQPESVRKLLVWLKPVTQKTAN